MKRKMPWPPARVRLMARGTRLTVLNAPVPNEAGIICDARAQPNLKLGAKLPD